MENITVDDGSYPATLSKVTKFNNAYGQRVGFEFTLDDGHKVMNQDQFRATTGKRRMPKFEGMYLSEMIATLGQKNGAFYFAK